MKMNKAKKTAAFIISLLLISAFSLPVFAGDNFADAASCNGFADAMSDEYSADAVFLQTTPDWWPEDVNSFRDFHNQNAPKVVDYADILTDSEESRLTDLICKSVAQTNIDFVIYTDTTNYGLGNQMCASDFYQFNGYGIGDDYNGSVFYLNMDPMERGMYTAARGDCRKFYTQETVNGLQDRAYDDLKEGNYEAAMEKYINAMTGLYVQGSIPEDSGAFLIRLVICLVIGLIAGGITVGALTSQMKKVRVATKAREYLVHDSIQMRAANDYYLFSTVTRTKIPKDSGKGGSSFSGGFSSHGGGSFSGGGRSF